MVDRQLPESMYDAALERRMYARIQLLEDQVMPRLQTLETPVFDPRVAQTPPNYIPNSHPEWSTMAYTTLAITPGTAGPTNYEAYNWYVGAATEDDMSAFTPLLGDGHGSYPPADTDTPVWDRTNGYYLLGSSGDGAGTGLYDVAAPLPTDFVFPGQRFYVYFEASYVASDTDDNSTEFYIGFYDQTGTQRKWIEGSPFTPTPSVYGSPGGRTLKYKILAETDTGDQMLSVEVSVNTAPATLTDLNHVRLFFSGAPGFIRYVIYRLDGTDYYRVGEIRNSIDLQFFDIQETGTSVVPVAGYPSVTGTTPKAYASTQNFTPGAVGTFAPHTMTIQVPTTYDRSNTENGMQWLRFGLESLVAAGSEQEVAIRRLMISEGYGAWTRCALDLGALSSPSSTAAGGSTPGGTTSYPPGGGSGGPICLPLDAIIPTLRGKIPNGQLTTKDHVVIGPMALPVLWVRDGEVQSLRALTTANGRMLRSSNEHMWITSLTDRRGKAACTFKVGDKILTDDFQETYITGTSEIVGQCTVRQIGLPPPNIYCADGGVCHNSNKEPQVPV